MNNLSVSFEMLLRNIVSHLINYVYSKLNSQLLYFPIPN